MYISRHFAQDDNNVVLLQTKPLNSLFHENILLYHQKIMNQIFFPEGGGGLNGKLQCYNKIFQHENCSSKCCNDFRQTSI